MAVEVRSEKPSLKSLGEILSDIRKTGDTDELATMMVLVTELYSDAECACEETAATYSEDSPEARSCWIGVNRSRDDMMATFKSIVEELKRK